MIPLMAPEECLGYVFFSFTILFYVLLYINMLGTKSSNSVLSFPRQAASPRHYREDEGLPITGEMRFDKVDIEGISDLKGVIVSCYLFDAM